MTDAPPSSPPAPDADREIFAPEPSRTPAERAFRSLVEWVVIIGGALLVALVVKTFLIQAFFIPSASMEPQLQIRDRVLVNKLSYRLHAVNRGDIIVFERPACDGGDRTIKDLIKRVIALPGETVEGRDGKVLINGQPLNEPYIVAGERTSNFPPERVPAGHVWVMGDNRDNSKDSRVLCGGPTPIPQSLIVGRAFVRVWPLPKFAVL